MTVVANTEVWASRRSTDEGELSEGVTTHVREFQVRTNSSLDDGAVILAATIVRGTAHPTDPFAYLIRREAIPDPNVRTLWRVILTYSTRKQLSTNPLDDAAEIEWGYSHFDRPVQKDRNDEGIVNSAGDPFVPAATRDDSRPLVLIRKNVAERPSWFSDYRDALNDAPWFVDGVLVAAQTAKVFDLRISPTRLANNIPFRTLECEIHIKDDGWDISELDRGFREKDGTNRKAIVNDSDSADLNEPVLLDGSGAVLSDPSTSNAVFLEFGVYLLKSFNVIPVS